MSINPTKSNHQHASLSQDLRSVDTTGKVVFGIAGMLVVLWFFGTLLYTCIPQSSKTNALASNSTNDEANQTSLTADENVNEHVLANLDNSESNLPNPEPKPAVPDFAEVETDSEKIESSTKQLKETAKSEPAPKTETAPIPQPKIEIEHSSTTRSKPANVPLVPVDPIAKAAPKPPTLEPTPKPDPMLIGPLKSELAEENIEPELEAPAETTYHMRDWISDTGGTARMTYVGRAEDGDVMVINDKGKQFKVPFSRFSELDKKYIENLEK